ncbi:MAG: GNAT family N-acetyltransferase [Candidatus Limnocylindrales bacterium]
MTEATVRRISPADGALLRDLRMRALADAPEAFGQTSAEAASRPDSEWVAAARAASAGDRRAWFIAEWPAATVPAAVGLILTRRRPPDAGLIFSMWVAPEHRRVQVGEALIEAAVAWASSWGASRMVLWVFSANAAAIRFYDRLGFVVERDGKDAESGRPYDALAMSLSLAAAGS